MNFQLAEWEKKYTLRSEVEDTRESIHILWVAKPLCILLHARSLTHPRARTESVGNSLSKKLPVAQTHGKEPCSGCYVPSHFSEYANSLHKATKLWCDSVSSKYTAPDAKTKIWIHGKHSAVKLSYDRTLRTYACVTLVGLFDGKNFKITSIVYTLIKITGKIVIWMTLK